MDPQILPNGNLLVPARVEGPDGLIGDTLQEIPQDSPEGIRWLDWMERNGLLKDSEEPNGD